MENQFNWEEFFFRYRWYLIALFFGILLILFGVLSISRQMPWFEGDKIEILDSEVKNDGQVTVEIAGAVEKPGVYELPAASRVEDLLIISGGLSAAADREWVGKTLNRAAKLTDGQKVYIPIKGEAGSVKGTSRTGSTNSGLVNINDASQAELEALSGIGPVTAQKIIEARPYSGVEELLTRKIVRKSVFEDNKDKLSVY